MQPFLKGINTIILESSSEKKKMFFLFKKIFKTSQKILGLYFVSIIL